jgi:hypothetical protein
MISGTCPHTLPGTSFAPAVGKSNTEEHAMQTFDEFWEEQETLVRELADRLAGGESHWHGIEDWLPASVAEEV